MPGSPSSGGSAGDGSAGSDSAGGNMPGDAGAGGGEPGFGDMAGGADLPSMVDTLPTFDETYGAEGNAEGGTQEGGAPDGDETGSGAGGNNGSGSAGQNSGVADSGDATGPGTRASGGMESDVGTDGPMTAAERVAILDRQLEESTRDFDGIIYDEEQRQREAARDRAAQTAQNPDIIADEMTRDTGFEETAPPPSAVKSDIEQNAATGQLPQVASVTIPEDIQNVQDDPKDIFARELRKAAMREPDPELREKLWSEYRAYKGMKEPTK